MFPVTKVKENHTDCKEAQATIDNGEVGCLILAGGMGTRLDSDGPKGCLHVPSYNKTLFEILLDKAEKMPVAVMVSPQNHQATKKALRGRECKLFQQEERPFLDVDKKEVSGMCGPDGNGGAFKAMHDAGILKDWELKGVRYVVVIPIDNPKAAPRNLLQVETLIQSGAELVVTAVEAGKEMGILVCNKKQLHVKEYSEKSVDGQYAYSGMFACTIDFAFSSAKRTSQLPWHLAKKVVNQKEIWKQERFIFDLFPLAKSYRIILQPRNECFAPIKYKEDII